MKDKLFGVVVFVMLFVACFAGLENNTVKAELFANEFQLTLNSSSQQYPDVYEYGLNWWAAVWQDDRNGNWDIYMYSQTPLGDGRYETKWDARITADSGSNSDPKIYNDTIVYQSNRNGNWDIYAYNLTSKVETQITTNPADQLLPDVYGDIIVWQDYRDTRLNYDSLIGLDIYMYNLTSHNEQRLPISEQNAYSPKISGDSIVYAAENYVKTTTYTLVYPYVCSYDLETGVKTNVASFEVEFRGGTGISPYTTVLIDSVTVCGSLVVWNTGQVIGVKDVSSSSTWESPSGTYRNPDVGGRFVVFQSLDADYWHIHVYDSLYGSFDQVTTALGNQVNCAISPNNPNFVVYQDDRSGGWHVYGSAFWFGVGAAHLFDKPITISRVIGELQEFKGMIADLPTSKFVLANEKAKAGGNDKLRENRQNAMLNQLDSVIADVDAVAYTQNLKLRTKYLQSAVDQLDEIFAKFDGLSQRGIADMPGSGFTPDWISAPFLDQYIIPYRVELQTLLDGVS